MTSTRSLESITFKISASVTVKNVMSLTPPRSAAATVNHSYSPNLISGNDEGEADRCWEYADTLADAASLVIDLYDIGSLDGGSGPGNDAVGQPIALASVVAILIKNVSVDLDTSDSEQPGVLEIEPDPSAGWDPIGSHTVATGGGLAPGGVLLKAQTDATGFEVTDAVSHRIVLTAVGGAVDFQIFVMGRGE